MNGSNKRKHKRLRIERTVKIPIHLFPKMPFIGASVQATLINLSAGGMAISLAEDQLKQALTRGMEIKIHFRLPGRPLQECWGLISHIKKSIQEKISIGIKFEKAPERIVKELELMAADNEACDYRINHSKSPWCVPNCAFFELCRKPIRPETNHSSTSERLEIALQTKE